MVHYTVTIKYHYFPPDSVGYQYIIPRYCPCGISCDILCWDRIGLSGQIGPFEHSRIYLYFPRYPLNRIFRLIVL